MTKIKKFFIGIVYVVLFVVLTLGFSSGTLFVLTKFFPISFTFGNVVLLSGIWFGFNLIKSTIKVIYKMSNEKNQSRG